MGGNVTFKGRLKAAIYWPLVFFVLGVGLNIVFYFIDQTAGICITGFLAVYLICWLISYTTTKKSIAGEALRFSEYDQNLQAGLIENMERPYVIMEPDGKILWMNRSFRETFGKKESYHKSIAGVFPSLTKEFLMKINRESQMSVQVGGRSYQSYIHRVSMEDYHGTFLDIDMDMREILVMLVLDETRELELMKQYEQERIAVALVYVDNYEEVTESIDPIKTSMVTALIDRALGKYFTSEDVLIRKFEEDKYFIVFKMAKLEDYKSDKFRLLEDVKSIKVGNEVAITLSIGIGANGRNYAENYKFARAAVDLALGRGGDQAVVREDEDLKYYGAATRQVERVSRVKARIKAEALREVMQTSEDVFIMGHQIGDVDSFGACIGIYHAAQMLAKPVYIVLDTVSSSIRPLKDHFTPANGYPDDMFLTPQEALDIVDEESMVMVVDCNRPSYTECPSLLEKTNTIVVFDHHRHGRETINNAVLSYIEPYASSTCEMITEVLQYFMPDELHMRGEEADALYAGIIIDTNNFMTKTGVRTFEAAAFLRREGADVTRVRKMMQNDMQGYKARAEAVRRAEVYRGMFAISSCPAREVASPTVAGAQAANELLNIIGIKASFVLTDYDGKIYISGRSIDEIDVQAVMEKFGGGGHRNMAGAQVAESTVADVTEQLKEVLDRMIEKGDMKL